MNWLFVKRDLKTSVLHLPPSLMVIFLPVSICSILIMGSSYFLLLVLFLIGLTLPTQGHTSRVWMYKGSSIPTENLLKKVCCFFNIHYIKVICPPEDKLCPLIKQMSQFILICLIITYFLLKKFQFCYDRISICTSLLDSIYWISPCIFLINQCSPL